jgi:hypothetical protein
MDAFDAAAWESYAVAMLGAAAVLVGLIFVGLSINLQRLLHVPWLVRRAGSALVELAAVLVASVFLLVPSQASFVLAIELMLRRRDEVQAPHLAENDLAAAMGILAVALYAVAGITVVAGTGGGLYWLVPAMLLCLGRAILDSWVLLVEINR